MLNPSLQETFRNLINRYSSDELLTTKLWDEITIHYSNESRHYHTLLHLENLVNQLENIRLEIKNWDVVLFTLFYHDIIYVATNSDNEEKSAELAADRMKKMKVPNEMIELCINQIIATKTHVHSNESDTNYFTDADLSILGQCWEDYTEYFKNVRKEYAVYPDILYNPGRIKVLNHFLSMDRIFKTDYFYNNLESKAKQNLQLEIDYLKLT